MREFQRAAVEKLLVSERFDGGESVAEGFGFFADQFSIKPDGFVAEGECGYAVGA